MIIRRATSHDLEAIYALEQRCFNYDQIGKRSFARLLKQQTSLFWCAETADQLIGYAIVLTRKNSRKWRLYSLATAPEARGKGVARALVQAWLEEAQRQAIQILSLEVKCDNAAAIQLYRNVGFEVVDLLSSYYSDGSDGYRMQLTLSTAS
ncbi:GNAT family N-acetyltransferase [Aliidiomarina haloalkalitolerans]|uniref:N-acetyltransferase n=1 Tax=Aliidiomarina haloalkalitolerans TaxID=859059 RepID=A0A432VU32_9GAMM|nr:N-acetyltransferase [Aliidiomarina haloalkalitolerans]MCL4409410.1 GNAT family N-acetyltransferase [Gammaproteobacteria bacterium]RUO19846.1 N-acetyltransferase [Aliidiomarina haloalkalitolerans]